MLSPPCQPCWLFCSFSFWTLTALLRLHPVTLIPRSQLRSRMNNSSASAPRALVPCLRCPNVPVMRETAGSLVADLWPTRCSLGGPGQHRASGRPLFRVCSEPNASLSKNLHLLSIPPPAHPAQREGAPSYKRSDPLACTRSLLSFAPAHRLPERSSLLCTPCMQKHRLPAAHIQLRWPPLRRSRLLLAWPWDPAVPALLPLPLLLGPPPLCPLPLSTRFSLLKVFKDIEKELLPVCRKRTR